MHSTVSVYNQTLVEKDLWLLVAKRRLAEAWLEQARRLRSNGDVRQAVMACERALALDPQNPEGYLRLASNLHTLERHDRAIPVLKQALSLRPHDPTACHLLNALEQRPAPAAADGYVYGLFERFAPTFDHRMNGFLNYRVPGMLARHIETITGKRNRMFDNALDLGCGTGLVGQALEPFTRQITGVDLSPKMLQQASQKKIYDVLQCDDVHRFLTVHEGVFDLITAADVFIYIVLSTDRIGLRLEHHQWLNGNLFIVGEKSYGKRRLHPPRSRWRQIGRRIFNGGGRAFLRN